MIFLLKLFKYIKFMYHSEVWKERSEILADVIPYSEGLHYLLNVF